MAQAAKRELGLLPRSPRPRQPVLWHRRRSRASRAAHRIAIEGGEESLHGVPHQHHELGRPRAVHGPHLKTVAEVAGAKKISTPVRLRDGWQARRHRVILAIEAMDGAGVAARAGPVMCAAQEKSITRKTSARLLRCSSNKAARLLAAVVSPTADSCHQRGSPAAGCGRPCRSRCLLP
jgi:hypothetical protein